ncbi:GerAB/ArcD/ProY family transporter [Metabacillus sp. HB246100]|uniref:GerAB/ArcD/ProY family transporter n=1 Tax=Bacillus weihaiensis TaxID=1547283 RepID=UPI0023553A2A|nr:GerAB/ArcD/ProY family transporter [Bacillus weihaiensis]
MKEKLHPFQVAILIYMIQSGVTLFSIPRLTAETFGMNGWAGLIIIFVVVTINLFLIALVYKFGKGKSIFYILEQVLPFWLVVPFYLVIATAFIIFAIMVTKKYIFILKMLFYHETPVYMFMGMAITLCFLMLKGSIYHIAKTTVVLFFMTIWTMFLLAYHIPEFSFTRLTPFFFKGETNLIEGGFNIFTAFLGYELSLLLFPYVEKNWTKGLYIGNSITFIIYFSVTLISFGFYSFNQLLEDMYPVITLLEFIKFPFIERVENLIFSLFALKVLITIVMYFWAGQEVLQHTLKRVKRIFITSIVLISGYLISLIPNIIREVDMWLEALTYIITGFAIITPLILLAIIGVIKLKNKEGSSS